MDAYPIFNDSYNSSGPTSYSPSAKEEAKKRRKAAKKEKKAAKKAKAESSAESSSVFIPQDVDFQSPSDSNEFEEDSVINRSNQDVESMRQEDMLGPLKPVKSSLKMHTTRTNFPEEMGVVRISEHLTALDGDEIKDMLGGVHFQGQDDRAGPTRFGNVNKLFTSRQSIFKKKGPMSALELANTTSHRFVAQSERGEVETYPADCYSFMSIHSPFEKPMFFLFGFVVFCFQILFLMYMVLSQVSPNLTNNGEIDNPSETRMAQFIPANVTDLVRATQVTSVLSYCLFADSSLKDCIMAVEMFPRLERATKEDKAWLVCLACLLRFIQGLLAIVATLLLIITGDDVIDIILNFAAVNYISALDEAAFELAKFGKYGPRLKEEATSIESRPIPYCVYRKNQHVRYIATVMPITLSLLITVFAVIYCQENSEFWVTNIVRVQFQESTGLRDYSGCYEIDQNVINNKRRNYNGYEHNPKKGVIGYCKDERHWILYKDNIGTGTGTDPCLVPREDKLANSATTDTFDVSTSFDELWYSASGTPLDLYFFDNEEEGSETELNCNSFLNNGRCDLFFNVLNYQYDGGDCCASTCSQSNCGANGLTKAFGENNTGNGFPHCVDPTMVNLTIHLNTITSSRNKKVLSVTDVQVEEYYREKGIAFWSEIPVTPLFIVDCDGVNVMAIYVDSGMENKSETLMVEDGSICQISVSNTTSFDAKWDNDPIWWVNYTVYHGNDTTNEIISGYSGDAESIEFHQIPQCYFEKLKNSIDVSTAYVTNDESTNALAWLAADLSGYSSCEDDFLIERFALSAVNFAAPINTTDDPSTEEDDSLWISTEQQCRWENLGCNEGSIETLAVRSKELIGTISSAVGLLSGLRRMDYDSNGLTGTIPSEIGLLINLKGLDIDNNELTGTIPTEFGKLVSMIELDLDKNKLTGTIPTEFGLMRNAREFDLIYNELTGSIPTEIGKCYSMSTFAVTGNKLSGPIPSEIGDMQNIEGLMLANNTISGTIPNEIKRAKTLRYLSLSGNSITGTIPPGIGKLTKLERLGLDMNKFTGTIPSEVGSMTSLTLINLYGNNLSGTIPTELGLLTNLREIRLDGNSLTGTIPIEILLLERLRIFTFNEGDLLGLIPSNIKTLAPCKVCQGQSRNYGLKTAHNNEYEVFWENGFYGIVGFSCRSLLQTKWDKAEMSSSACKALQDICIFCDDDGDYYEDEDVHVPAFTKLAASGKHTKSKKVYSDAADTTKHVRTAAAGNTNDTGSDVIVVLPPAAAEQAQTSVRKDGLGKKGDEELIQV